MSKRLLWLHHAPIERDTQEIVGSGTNRELSDHGLFVARSMARALFVAINDHRLPEPDRVIMTSPLKRATQTAEIIAEELEFDVQRDDRLRAQFFGDLEGKTIPELEKDKRLKPFLYRNIDPEKRFDHRAAGDGESVGDVWVRTMEVRRELFKPTTADRLIITHGTVLDTVIGSLRALKHWDWDGVNREYPGSVIVDEMVEMKIVRLEEGSE